MKSALLLLSSLLTLFLFQCNNATEQTTLCGDLLANYAQKPEQLTFVDCETIEGEQVIARATYIVSGKEAEQVEAFLKKHYQMGALKWTCCGWDNGGKLGHFEHAAFQKIDPYCTATVSMFASGEVEDEQEAIGVRLEQDRTKIEEFRVVVELVMV